MIDVGWTLALAGEVERPSKVTRRWRNLSVRERTYWLCTAWLSVKQMHEWPLRLEYR
jgi:hypothetical protein